LALTLEWEPIQNLKDDGAEDLLFQHWRETESDLDRVPLSVDWEWMKALEAQKMFHCAALRRNGRLIGYNAFQTYRHIHFRHTLHAINDGVFIEPSERGMAGVRIIRGVEPMLKSLGVARIMYGAKLRARTAGDLLARLGYSHTENIYCKLIG